jgi:hypothetical protein
MLLGGLEGHYALKALGCRLRAEVWSGGDARAMRTGWPGLQRPTESTARPVRCAEGAWRASAGRGPICARRSRSGLRGLGRGSGPCPCFFFSRSSAGLHPCGRRLGHAIGSDADARRGPPRTASMAQADVLRIQQRPPFAQSAATGAATTAATADARPPTSRRRLNAHGPDRGTPPHGTGHSRR